MKKKKLNLKEKWVKREVLLLLLKKALRELKVKVKVRFKNPKEKGVPQKVRNKL